MLAAYAGTLGLSFLAGVLSILSPCVLPLLPILVGAALSRHRNGPLLLALGLGLSFTLAGVALAGLGQYLGFDQGWLRNFAAILLLLFGALMLSTGLSSRFALLATGLGQAGSSLSRRIALDGLRGQFALGMVLGLVWAPCVGPTLGAAITLASQRQGLYQVIFVMLAFGIGAALPLAVLGKTSRAVMIRMRGTLMQVGAFGKFALGVLMIVVGVSILAGLDKGLEARLVEWSPDWLTDLTTRY